MKSADVEKCQGVKRYLAIENRYIYIYVCHCWRSVKSIFHQGKDFYQGQEFFEFTSANFFDDRERKKERNYFVLFRFSFSFRKIVLIIPPLNCTSSVYFEIYRASRISHFLSEIKYFFSEI